MTVDGILKFLGAGHGRGRTLLCLPHAGGDAGAFRSWAQAPVGGADVVSIDLPGRRHLPGSSARSVLGPGEPSLRRLACDVADEVVRSTQGPVALFGHSMGAVLAFEVAREMHRRAAERLSLLVVSGRDAPWSVSPLPVFHRMPDDRLWRSLRALGGIPAAVADDQGMRELFLPVLRADLTILEEHRAAAAVLGCPVRVYAGQHDALVTEEGLAAWAGADHDAAHRRFPGGHFYLAEHRAEVLRALTADLAETTTGTPATGARGR
ncbi:MAG TPA: alpha/beta fold hydrolase [Pseudonocardia sp.]|uniref:thioesterase II family protein n=1 Tax=Pseudonocardia sp. TaxID=60912 RepID=UPI002F423DCF